MAPGKKKTPLYPAQETVTHAAVTKPERIFPPLETVTTPTVDTASCAHYLNRRPQTLRCWASEGGGLLTPRKLGVRLAWDTAAIRRLLGVAQ